MSPDPKKYRLTFALILVCVFTLAFVVRIFGIYKGLPYLHYFDEPAIAVPALDMMKTGELNPGQFHYGSLIIYMNLGVFILNYFSLVGQPETAESFIRATDHIVTSSDGEWMWTISHPSFYQWGRALTVLFGFATVVLCYRLARDIFNRWAGLLGAAFLAINAFHIYLSRQIAVDVPASFFTLSTVFFAVQYAKSTDLRSLCASLVCAGFAVAIKYNSGLVVLVPIAALLALQLKGAESYTHWLWLLVPTVPAVACLAAMPYMLLDLPTFLNDAGSEIFHYKVSGHGANSIEPGFTHFVSAISEIYGNVGPLIFVCAIIGAIVVLFKESGWLLWVFPAVFVFFQSGMKVDFHRNFIGIYPFITVFAGCGVAWLYLLIRPTSENQPAFQLKRIAAMLIVSITGTLLLYSFGVTVRDNYAIWTKQETRTQAMEAANNLMASGRFSGLVIASELRPHAIDLRLLKFPFQTTPLANMSRLADARGILFLVPEKLGASVRAKVDSDAITSEYSQSMNRIKNYVVGGVGGVFTDMDIYSQDPGITFTLVPPEYVPPIDYNLPVWLDPHLPDRNSNRMSNGSFEEKASAGRPRGWGCGPPETIANDDEYRLEPYEGEHSMALRGVAEKWGELVQPVLLQPSDMGKTLIVIAHGSAPRKDHLFLRIECTVNGKRRPLINVAWPESLDAWTQVVAETTIPPDADPKSISVKFTVSDLPGLISQLDDVHARIR